jgi:hypothetical protein
MFATPGPLDFVAVATPTLQFWEREHVFSHLAARNRGGRRFSFLDGPITANNPMGIHHAWGRTLKDVVQRYRALCGYDQRFQNGFDCQGLWVEVEVEKTLGFNSKREIESFGLERFSRACRDRVTHFAQVQTEQSKKLGQWMDWPTSYFTMSDANTEYNWGFLRRCHERGWLYTGHRPMPWCTRCGTSISQHEMLDAYTERTHASLTVALPLRDRPDHRLLVWTTTPWTLPANVAVAVHPGLDYAEFVREGTVYYVAAGGAGRYPALGQPRRTVKGAEFVGLAYVGPFDELPVQRGIEHRVLPWEGVSAEEGTGIVHIAPGCGLEDFDLGRRHGLPVIAPVDPEGRYVEGLGPLSGTPVVDAAAPIAGRLKERGLLFARASYRHRYPSCWRCGQELIFRVADEWFLSAAEIRPLARAANERVTWLPGYMQLRMDDWLANMGDWCISRKRYWGPAPALLPMRVRAPHRDRLAPGASGAGHGPRGGRRGPGAAPSVARRHPHPLRRLRPAGPAHPRGRRLLARRRDRTVLDAGLPRGPPAMGGLVPGRLRRRGRGAASRVVLRDALHVDGPRRNEPLPDRPGARARARRRRARDAQELGQCGLARRRAREDGSRRDPPHVRFPGDHRADPLRLRGGPGRQAAIPDVLERLPPLRHLRERRPAGPPGTRERAAARSPARAMAAEPPAGHDRRGARGLRHLSDPPRRRRRRHVHPRRSVELVRAAPPARVLEGHPRPREAGRVPGPLPRARTSVPAPRPGHAVHHRAHVPEPGPRRAAGGAGQPPSHPLPGAGPRAGATRPGSRRRGGATSLEGGARGPQRRPPRPRSGGPSWWRPPTWSAPRGPSSWTSATI